MFASAGAFAQAQGLRLERGWYGGASLGSSRADLPDSALPVAGATASNVSRDNSGTGFKLYVGYQYNPHFAFEAGYTDLGKFRVTRNVTAPAALIGSATADTRAQGLHLDAVGTIPLQGGFSLFAKLGGIYATTQTSLASSGGVIAGTSSRRSGWDWKWGVGAGYDFSRGMGLRLEYEKYRDVPSDDLIGRSDAGVWSLGLKSRF